MKQGRAQVIIEMDLSVTQSESGTRNSGLGLLAQRSHMVLLNKSLQDGLVGNPFLEE